MASRVRIFVDYWNFQLNWNERAGKERRCDWKWLWKVLLEECRRVLGPIGVEDMTFEEMRIYASVDPDPGEDQGLKRWLDGFLNCLPGYYVDVRPRRKKPKTIHCPTCQKTFDRCPNPECNAPFVKRIEKGVDTAMVTDLLALAWEKAYDTAILVSSDTDFVGCVEHLQRKGMRVVNGYWRGQAHELVKACWASLRLDDLIPRLEMKEADVAVESGSLGLEKSKEMEAFIEEIRRAVSHFEARGGFLGARLFVERWQSRDLPSAGKPREDLLAEAESQGYVEIYDARDQQGSPVKAIRLPTQDRRE